MFCLFSRDIYLFYGVSISSSFCECNSLGDFFETLVILYGILLSIKSPIPSAIFWIALFEAFFIASVVDFVAYLEVFNHYLLFMFFAKDKNLYPSTILISKPYFNSLKFWIRCFEKDMTFGEISNKQPNDLFGTNISKTLESCW